MIVSIGNGTGKTSVTVNMARSTPEKTLALLKLCHNYCRCALVCTKKAITWEKQTNRFRESSD